VHTVAAISALQIAGVGVSVAGTRDALAQDLVVRGVLVDSLVAKLTAATQLAGIPEVTIVAHLAMVTRIALRTLGAYVFRMLDQLELRIQVHVVVAL